jgi:hypothetical protein
LVRKIVDIMTENPHDKEDDDSDKSKADQRARRSSLMEGIPRTNE